VDDADAVVLDEHQDVGSGVGSPDADVVQSPLDVQRYAAGLVHLVVAEAVVDVGAAVGAGAGFGAGGVGGNGGMLRAPTACFRARRGVILCRGCGVVG
jgi:hypothetical protein